MIKGRKRHLVTDMLGLMLRVEVHSAGVQDRDGVALVLDRITRRFPLIEKFFAAAGYQGPRVAAAAPRPVEIIRRSEKGFVVQPKRWVVECTFAWANRLSVFLGPPQTERTKKLTKFLFDLI